MDRKALEELITQFYGAKAEYPWSDYPRFAVFRHDSNKKWFALIMELPKSKLGLRGDGTLDAVNLKCDPFSIGALRSQKGFFPAYHMNKEHWITAALDGSAPDEDIRTLLDLSYELTAPKNGRKKQRAEELQTQTDRITRYEALMNEALSVLKANAPRKQTLRELRPVIAELEAYYGSRAWREDFNAWETGKLPETLRCGVLSEDGLFDLLETFAELEKNG